MTDVISKLLSILLIAVRLFTPKKERASVSARALGSSKELADHEEKIAKLHAEEVADRESIAGTTSLHDRLEAIRQRMQRRADQAGDR